MFQTRKTMITLLALLAISLAGAAGIAAYVFADAQDADERIAITVYKDPSCGCCRLWEEHLEANGFAVDSRPVGNLNEVKRVLGLPPQMASCHTAVVDGLLVEGHVPAEVVHRFLTERPAGATGIAVPGMPLGSPGMEMPDGRKDAYDVMVFDATGNTQVYSRH